MQQRLSMSLMKLHQNAVISLRQFGSISIRNSERFAQHQLGAEGWLSKGIEGRPSTLVDPRVLGKCWPGSLVWRRKWPRICSSTLATRWRS